MPNIPQSQSENPGAPNLGTFGAESLIDQHKLVPPRPLRSRLHGMPRVLLAILAKQKEPALPLYLDCIEALDYPKSSVVLHIRTNNNTDRTEQILREWVARVGHLYAAVEFDATDVADRVEQFREHEWNATRFRVLGRIRNVSMRRALAHGCAFYFVADVDNFIRPATLRELVALDLPIVGPLLRSIVPGAFYSNYHAEVTAAGYYRACDQYFSIFGRYVRGILEVPVIHCTYLVRADVIPQLTYEDETTRHEYVVFSDSARTAGIPQYIDNRQVYGYITFGDSDAMHRSDGIERARALLSDAGDRVELTAADEVATRGVAGVMPIHLINLDRSTDRLAQFQERNAHLGDVIRFPAVNGRLVNKEALIDEGVMTRDCDYQVGSIGCALSHIALWNKAVAENLVVTVFEDDTIASYRFREKSAQLMATLPEDWDLIHWGWHYHPTFVWADFGFSKAELQFYDHRFSGPNLAKFQSADFAPAAVRLAHVYGALAYSVSPKGARALLNYCLPF